MSALNISKLSKKKAKLRMALVGPPGSGKTYTALTFARALTDGPILVIDTEHGTAGKFADKFNKDGRIDSAEIENYSPATYSEALKEAAAAGYEVIIVDSLSHAWMGKDGALEQVDKIAKRSQSGNTFNAWRDVTPMHNELIETILSSPHIICTMRAKTEYVIEENDKGKKVPRKIGLAPVQRDGMEYEFDIVADMDTNNTMIVSKSRMDSLAGEVIRKPTAEVAERIRTWLEDGEEVPVNTNALQIQAKDFLASIGFNKQDFDAFMKKERIGLSWFEEALGAKAAGVTDKSVVLTQEAIKQTGALL